MDLTRAEIEKVNGWNVCTNRLQPTINTITERLNKEISQFDAEAQEQLNKLIEESTFFYFDTYFNTLPPAPQTPVCYSLVGRILTDNISDKLKLAQEIERLNLFDHAPRSYFSIDQARANAEPDRVIFVKGRYGAFSRQVYCLRSRDLATYTLPRDHIVQEAVQNIELYEGRKMVLRFYILTHEQQVYLSTHAVVHIRGANFDPESIDRDVQIIHKGDLLKKIPLGQYESANDHFQRLQTLTQAILPIIDKVRRASKDGRFMLFGADGVPSLDGTVKLLEINSYPNLFEGPTVESVYVPMFASLMAKVVLGMDDNSWVKV